MKKIKKQILPEKADDIILKLEHAGVKNLSIIEIPSLACLAESKVSQHPFGNDGKYSVNLKKEIINADDVLFISIDSDGVIIL